MAKSLLQNETDFEMPSSATQAVADKQSLDDVNPSVEDISPRNLHGVKVSPHSHKRNAGRSWQPHSHLLVGADYNGNPVYHTSVQFGHDNRRISRWPHTSVLPLITGCQRLPMYSLVLSRSSAKSRSYRG